VSGRSSRLPDNLDNPTKEIPMTDKPVSIYDAFGTDEDLETNGVWVDWGDLGKFKIAAVRNPRHQKAIEKYNVPFKSFIQSGRPVPQDKQEEITNKALAEAVLVDWSGLKDRDGTDLPYSFENAYRLLTDLKRFRLQVIAVAMEAETFRQEAVQEAAGN
jgi:hypothetical protein